ncbi:MULTISPECIES: YadA-like family protein [Lysobacter]|uniref:YadA-like family protein n=1 Tax=Lysobacter firmicutimachus TaxID=1792846 RepID=A0ABU8D0X7_9GAMM|nr:YadA-like family protein [Lysobacter antibioticus]
MNISHKTLLATALSLACASAWAGEPCVLDDGFGGTTTGGATANGGSAIACGQGASADGDFAVANGAGATASAVGAIAVGANSTASGDQSSALGAGATASGANSSAIGDSATASGEFSTANGSASTAGGRFATASGAGSTASADNATALGANSSASAAGAVALGSDSIADRASTVSIGSAGAERQLVNLAAGTADTDAVNVFQLNTLAGALGGGASFAGGVFTAPTYAIQGGSYRDVGSAFAAVDGRLTDLYGRVGAGAANSVTYTDASQTQVALQGAGGTRVSNVAAGTAPTDAANVAQVQSGDAQTLRSANAYTDSRVTQMLAAPTEAINELRDDMNWRFHKQDRRIDKLGAMTAAMVQMSASASGLNTPNRIAVGAGFQGGQQALSIGYQRAISDRATVTLGGAFSDSESSAGVGVGFGW